MSRFSVWHPLLFAVFPIFMLQANNLSEIPLSDGSRALVLSLASSLLMLAALRLILRDLVKAALVVSVVLLIFFSYGHIYLWLSGLETGALSIARHRYLAFTSLASIGLALLLVARAPAPPRELGGLLAAVGLVAMALPLARIGEHQFRAVVKPALEAPREVRLQPSGIAGEAFAPDVFYIVLDGYARADVLEELYDFDNSSFIEFLEDQGFYVARQASSNYNQTVFSIAAALNMDYVDNFGESLGVSPGGRGEVADLLKRSRAMEFLTSMGYEVVSFPTGYAHTEIREADIYLSPDESTAERSLFSLRFNRLEGLLLETTAARILLDTQYLKRVILGEHILEAEYTMHRNRVLHTLSTLPEIAGMEGPQFVFAHVITPHPPFVFGPNGEEVLQGGAYSLADGNWYGGKQTYVEGYRDQLTFVNKLLRWTIREILRRSDSPPIIVVQADHGPGAFLVWESADETNLKERLAILSAYYFPGEDYSGLYASITPVNSFRVVLSDFFGAGLSPVEDESYFSTWEDPMDYLRVTDQVGFLSSP